MNAVSKPISLPVRAPAIGSIWPGQGGYYAGLARGQDGAPDYHLIVAPAAQDAIKWKAAQSWASTQDVDGHRDYDLPDRHEQALLFANVPELFEKDWYWSGAQHASDPDFAWSQHFSLGHQFTNLKYDALRARAVRRLNIQ